MAKCPYTKVKVLAETTSGTVIEKNPEKDDNIFEVGEEIAYLIELNDHRKHIKKPVSGIIVTIYNPDKKPTTQITDYTGQVRINLNKEGRWIVTHYDVYQKRSIIISFIAVKPKDIPKPEPVIVVVPEDPNCTTLPHISPVVDDNSSFTIETGPSPIPKENTLKHILRALKAILGALFKRK